MCYQNHDPDERPAEECHADHEDESCRFEIMGEKYRHGHSGARCQHSQDRHTLFAQTAERPRRIAAPRKREEQSCCEVEIAHGARKRRCQHHEIHHKSLGGNAHGLENTDEGTLAKPDLIPRHESDHQRQSPEIEEHEKEKCTAKCLRDGDSRLYSFPSSRSYNLDPEKTKHRHSDSEEHTRLAVRKKTALSGVVDGPDAGESDPKQKRCS